MTRAKTRGRVSKATSALTETGKRADVEVLRQKIANYVGGKALLMVKTATEEAVKVGDLSAMKYLFELIGLYPGTAGETRKPENENDNGNEIAAALLAELEISASSEAEAFER